MHSVVLVIVIIIIVVVVVVVTAAIIFIIVVVVVLSRALSTYTCPLKAKNRFILCLLGAHVNVIFAFVFVCPFPRSDHTEYGR